MKTVAEVKKFIADKIAEKGLTFQGVSLELGKNTSYLHGFVTKKSPERLKEYDRKRLADILDVDEQELSDLPIIPRPKIMPNQVRIKIVDVVACCGTGIVALQENVIGTWDIPLIKFRDFSASNPDNAYMFQVTGDSMQPTLNSGDWAIADMSQNFISSDGLYLIRTASGLSVKRILSGLNDVQVISDNPNYPNFTASVGEITILGRVIYLLNAHKVG